MGLEFTAFSSSISISIHKERSQEEFFLLSKNYTFFSSSSRHSKLLLCHPEGIYFRPHERRERAALAALLFWPLFAFLSLWSIGACQKRFMTEGMGKIERYLTFKVCLLKIPTLAVKRLVLTSFSSGPWRFRKNANNPGGKLSTTEAGGGKPPNFFTHILRN